MAQPQRFIQQLTIHLSSGQSVKIWFKADKPDVFNLRIEGFLAALHDKNKQNSTYLFEGSHVVFVRIAEVISAEARSFICTSLQAPSSSPENVSISDEKQLLVNDSEPSSADDQIVCRAVDLP